MLENLPQDLRYGARMLWNNPAFTFVAVLTLGLGIGANTAIFSIIDVLLFRPLPVSKPNQLVRIFNGQTRGNEGWKYLSLPEFQDYRDQSTVFSGLAAYVDRFPANVSAGRFGTERVDAGMVTGNYFQVIGASAGWAGSCSPQMTNKIPHLWSCWVTISGNGTFLPTQPCSVRRYWWMGSGSLLWV
jgi:hypothetical protein